MEEDRIWIMDTEGGVEQDGDSDGSDDQLYLSLSVLEKLCSHDTGGFRVLIGEV